MPLSPAIGIPGRICTVGNATTQYSGIFNVQRYDLQSFHYSSTTNDVGLFGLTNGATIENIGLTTANVRGQIMSVYLLVKIIIQAQLQIVTRPYRKRFSSRRWSCRL